MEQNDQEKATANINNALFELMPDDAESIANRRKIVRWDNKKNRYVRGTVGELKDNVHIRNESGKLIRERSKIKRGELYAKWRKSHRMNEQAIGGKEEEASEEPRSQSRWHK